MLVKLYVSGYGKYVCFIVIPCIVLPVLFFVFRIAVLQYLLQGLKKNRKYYIINMVI